MTAFRCEDAVWEQVEEHVFSSTDREVGGILAGRLDDGVTVVTAVLPALAATSGSANVTFTHEVWEQVHEAMDRDHPGSRIVGWYHSHPGFGVFLSEYDAFAHRSFFAEPALLALVVDPLAGEAGWFAMQDGEPAEVERRATVRAPLRPASGTPTSAGAVGSRAALVRTAGVAVAAAVAGFLLGGSVGGTPLPPARPAVAAAAATPPTPTPTPTAQPTARPRPATTPAARPAAPAALVYRVRRGDSLSRLAASFYGDPALWPLLKAANPPRTSDLLEVGERLRVPVTLEDQR